MVQTRKIFLSAVMTGLLILSGCVAVPGASSSAASVTPSSSVPETTSNLPELGFRITWKEYSGRGEAIRQIVDSYNASGVAGVQVREIGGDEDEKTVASLLVSEPNAVYVLPYRYVKYFGDAGNLMNLSEDFSDCESFFYPEIWSLGTLGDSLYGIPWLGHSMCLLYNRSLLEEAGVDPKSITDTKSFADALAAVQDKTDANGIGLVGAESNDISWMVNQFVYGFGSSLVDATGTKVTVNNEQAKEAIAYYRDTLGAYAQPDWTEATGVEVMDSFRAGKVAFEIQGIWGVTDIEKNGSPFEVGVLPMSAIGMRSEVGPMMVVIPSGMRSDLVLEAQSFIRYLISTGAQQQIMNGEYSPEHDAYYPFRTPIRIDMKDDPIFAAHPEYAIFVTEFGNPSIDVPVPGWQTVKDQLYQPGLHKVMTGETEINDFLRTVEEEGAPLLQSSANS